MIKDALYAATHDLDVDKHGLPEANASWNMRGASLLQVAYCGPLQDCYGDQLQLTLLLVVLCSAIFLMVIAFAFFREDKDEMFTPLTPQLVVKKEAKLEMTIPLDSEEETIVVKKANGEVLVKARLELPDPFRPGQFSSCGVAMVSIQNTFDSTLALVAARNPTYVGQGLALCRREQDVFASVEPLSQGKGYHVKHRTGYPLLTLMGDFDFKPGGAIDIQGFNKDGAQICGVKKTDSECRAWVLQYIDAGLVIASLLAVHLQKRLTSQMVPAAPMVFPHEVQDESPPRSDGAPEEPMQDELPPVSS